MGLTLLIYRFDKKTLTHIMFGRVESSSLYRMLSDVIIDCKEVLVFRKAKMFMNRESYSGGAKVIDDW